MVAFDFLLVAALLGSAYAGTVRLEGIADDDTPLVFKPTTNYFPADDKGKEYFYWVFESRNDPNNDPVILWMTGGPGCSSLVALFKEHGPCTINKDGKTTTPNPYSWNERATIIYIDQPSGVGYSRGPADETGEWDIGPQAYKFLQSFFAANEYLRDNEFYIFGESYGGHYVPTVATIVNEKNKALRNGELYINLKGIGIGNGLTDPIHQYSQFPEFAFKNPKKPVVGNFAYKMMKMGATPCTSLIQQCESGTTSVCLLAAQTCNIAMMLPIQLKGLNVYDITKECEHPPLCYDFSDVSKFANNPQIRAALGVTPKDRQWQECNMMVNIMFLTDFMQTQAGNVTQLLHDGLRVLVYSGENDYICNYFGGREWTRVLDWKGKDGFQAAGEHDWVLNGQSKGTVRSHGGLTFLSIKDAGHMVPMDQPEAAQVLLNTFVQNKNYY